jgi:putative ABC transport system substrate-binding protein
MTRCILRLLCILGLLVGPLAAPAQQVVSTMPIVKVVVTDPVANGHVASLARPGGNLTGVRMGTAELGGKYLTLLAQVVPRAVRVAYPVEGNRGRLGPGAAVGADGHAAGNR